MNSGSLDRPDTEGGGEFAETQRIIAGNIEKLLSPGESGGAEFVGRILLIGILVNKKTGEISEVDSRNPKVDDEWEVVRLKYTMFKGMRTVVRETLAGKKLDPFIANVGSVKASFGTGGSPFDEETPLEQKLRLRSSFSDIALERFDAALADVNRRAEQYH
jgi:hypothetical protein